MSSGIAAETGRMRPIGMVRYYRFTLALPLAVAAVAYLLGRGPDPLTSHFPDVVWFSMLLGGFPYAALAAFMFIWIKGKSEQAIHRVIYLSPFFMVLLVAVAAAAFFPVLHAARGAGSRLADAVARHSLFTLVLGYLYVAAVQLTYLSLKAMRRIRIG